MMGSGVLPGLREAGRKSINETYWGKKKDDLCFYFWVYTKFFAGAGEKTAQITSHLTVLNHRRSNIWYSAKLRNSVVCQQSENCLRQQHLTYY